jgi:C1A family cysteine protease
LNNVTFINCLGGGESFENSGAVYSYNTTLNVNNCKFIDNGGENGASITSVSGAVNVADSTFASSSDKIIKGQIYLSGSVLNVDNSNFLNTTSKYAAAIFSINDGSVIVKNSKFKNMFAYKTAGAIGAKVISKLTISNCEFDNVSSINNGGAIYADIFGDGSVFGSMTSITNSVFNNCYSGFGGAVLQLDGNLVIKNTNFTSNAAGYEGGAVYTSYTDVKIYNSKFKSNIVLDDVSYGGSCYFDDGSALLNGNDFVNNTGYEGSAIYAYDNDLTLTGNYFNNPSDAISVCTVYGKVIKDNNNNYTSDIKSFNNANNFYNFEGTPNQLNITNNTISFDKMPVKFDLRNYSWVTPVKDQGFMGSCWAFGNMAALESSLLRYTNVTYSLSVNNMQNSMLKYSKYGVDTLSEGGNAFTAVAYLIDWLGGFSDDYDGYDELGKISSLYITPENIHIQNAVVIPTMKTASDRDLIKNALINYGAVAASHRADFNQNKYFNKTSSAQYCYDESESTHRICIVGWDDNYSKDNFLKTPEGDGAWICKNSWGTNWGDEGYFYLSYYDPTFGDKESVCYIVNNDSYNRIYQHDVGGEGKWIPEGKYYANIFTAEEDELISAVGTFFNQSGREYEFNISVNDVLVYTQKGISKLSGYETIKLDKLVQIKKGDKFKVTFKNMLYVANDLRIHPQAGQSFVSDNGKEWEDLRKVLFIGILKAYTVSDLNITNNLVKYYKNDTPFVAKVGANETVIFEFGNKNYTVIADENGSAIIPIDSDVGGYSITTTYNNVSIVNYVLIKSTIVSSDVNRGYNSNYNYKVQLLTSAGTPLNNTQVPISVNGKSKNYTTDASGYVTVPFTKLTKQQTIVVVNPSNNDKKQTKIVVKSRFSGASNVVMYYFDGSKFKARIVGNDGNFVGKGQTVIIKLNKKTYKAKTSVNGYITLKIPKTLKPGTYKLTATYKGQTIKKAIKVKQNLKTTKKYSVKKTAKKLVIKATLKNGKKAVKGKKITLNINGKKFSAKTNKYGIAKFTIKKNVIKKLKKGKTYTVKVTYLKNTIKTKVKVR